MNKSAENFYRKSILEGLSKLSEPQCETFESMYGKVGETIKSIVANMSIDELDWALTQVENTLPKQPQQKTVSDMDIYNQLKDNVLYLVRNTEREFLGNAPIWWKHDDQGYTAYLRDAKYFLKKEIQDRDLLRSCKFEAIPLSDIEKYARIVFDWQDADKVRIIKKEETKDDR